MTSIQDLAEKLWKDAESVKIYATAIVSRDMLGASLDETLRILEEKVRILNEGFEELHEVIENET
jgi:2-hydroxy-3-keto-5-methylthiopentenyl-1-phosphate phosphatase